MVGSKDLYFRGLFQIGSTTSYMWNLDLRNCENINLRSLFSIIISEFFKVCTEREITSLIDDDKYISICCFNPGHKDSIRIGVTIFPIRSHQIGTERILLGLFADRYIPCIMFSSCFENKDSLITDIASSIPFSNLFVVSLRDTNRIIYDLAITENFKLENLKIFHCDSDLVDLQKKIEILSLDGADMRNLENKMDLLSLES